MIPQVSLCMIVRDEEAKLGKCLDSVADLVEEIIVVDTGSVDRSKQLAKDFGAHVYDFAWIDDFSAARNESLRHANGEWIFWLDTDEWIDNENRVRLTNVFNNLNGSQDGYRMQQRSQSQAAAGDGEAGTLIFQQVRLFPNDPRIRWQYRVHEQIGPAIEAEGGTIHDTDVFVEHTGYSDPQLQICKAKRNLHLLQREVSERPDDAFSWLNLGWTLKQLGSTAQALPHLYRSLTLAVPGHTVDRKAIVLLTRSHYELGHKREALETCQAGRNRYPNDIELIFLEAVLLSELGDLHGAEDRFVKLLDMAPSAKQMPAGFDTSCCGYKARHNLARIYRVQNRFQAAEAQWRAALQESPSCIRVWIEMGQMFLSQGRASDVDELVRGLQSLGQPGQEAAEQLKIGAKASHLFNTAEELFKAGRQDEAESLYHQQLEGAPQRGTALWRLGMIANHRQNFDLAWEYHRQAILADPKLAATISSPNAPHHNVICHPHYDVEEVTACPVCDSSKHQTMMVVNSLAFNHHHASIDPIRRWVRCADCDHGYANPRPSAEAVTQAYQNPPPAHLQSWSYDRLTKASDIIHELWQQCPGGELLDIGIGIGSLAGVAMDYGYRVTGMDRHAGYTEQLQRLGVNFIHGDVNTYDFKNCRFDVICMGDVIEHIADPRRTLKTLLPILNEKGLIWISTPNYEGTWTRALGDRDAMWMEGEHLQFFSLRSLRKMLEDFDLTIVDYRLSKTFVGCVEIIAKRA